MKDRNPLAYALRRLRGIFRPPVRILPPPQGVRFDRDVEVTVRDGTRLRVNVFRPQAEGRYPVPLRASVSQGTTFLSRTDGDSGLRFSIGCCARLRIFSTQPGQAGRLLTRRFGYRGAMWS